MKKLTTGLLVFWLAAFGVSAFGQDDAASALGRLLGNIDTLSADVQQLLVESDGGILEESEILMRLRQPNGFYWETISPFPELIVTDGETLWNYQPDLEQVVIEPWDSSESELAAQLLAGETANLDKEYVIESSGGDTETHTEFSLTPIASESVYAEIRISFFQKQLDMIRMRSKNGQQTVWQFMNLSMNTPLDPDLFTFEPPAEVEIINNNYVP